MPHNFSLQNFTVFSRKSFGLPPGKNVCARAPTNTSLLNKYSNSLYLRFEVKDRPGVLSQITKQLAKYKMSIQRHIQKPDNLRKKASIIIITHNVKEYYSKKCMNSFKSNKNVLKTPVLIRLF